jgi:L-2,4-diaminobutyrate decarboxylase
MHDDFDFLPDRAGLSEAMDRLVAARDRVGSPHPSEPAGTPTLWPDAGVGGRAAQRLRHDMLPDDLSSSILVLTAGTTAAGAVDDLGLDTTAAWTHVDAAWAGALRWSSRAHVLDGIDRADSVALSAHKWLYQPKDSALVLFRDSGAAHAAMTFSGGYLAVPNIGVLGSSGARAVPLMVTLLAWGRSGLTRRLDADLAVADDLARRVAAEPRLVLWRPPVTGIVNWRPRDADVEEVRRRLRQAWVSTAVIDGKTWLHSVAANPAADPDHVVRAVIAALDG